MHYILFNGRVACSASEFTPDPPQRWIPGLSIQFTTEVFRPHAGMEIEIIDFDGTGWAATVLSSGEAEDFEVTQEVHISALVERRTTALLSGKDAVAKYIEETFDGLVHLSLVNYSDAEGARMIQLILGHERRPVIHKAGLPPVEAILNQDGGLDWIPFPSLSPPWRFSAEHNAAWRFELQSRSCIPCPECSVNGVETGVWRFHRFGHGLSNSRSL